MHMWREHRCVGMLQSTGVTVFKPMHIATFLLHTDDPKGQFMPLESPEKATSAVDIQSWSDFCKWRGVGLSSPTPLIMTWALTLWHSVECLLACKAVRSTDCRSDCPSAIGEQKRLRVVIAGAAAVEVAQLASLCELLHLWPEPETILVALVGPGTALSNHGSVQVLRHGGDR